MLSVLSVLAVVESWCIGAQCDRSSSKSSHEAMARCFPATALERVCSKGSVAHYMVYPPTRQCCILGGCPS